MMWWVDGGIGVTAFAVGYAVSSYRSYRKFKSIIKSHLAPMHGGDIWSVKSDGTATFNEVKDDGSDT